MPKTFKFELCISSKLHDLVAKSAKATLWEMGYKELSDMKREIYFSLCLLAKNKEGAELMISKMVKETTLFVNPNKDTYKLKTQNLKLKTQNSSVDVLIWYIDDNRGEIIRKQLKNQGFTEILSVSQGELWHLFLSKKTLAPLIINGLLVNPHSQRYEIL